MMILFSAPWCSPCRALKRLFNENNISFKEISVDEHADLANQHDIRALPTVIVTNSEGIEINRAVGTRPLQVYKDMLEK